MNANIKDKIINPEKDEFENNYLGKIIYFNDYNDISFKKCCIKKNLIIFKSCLFNLINLYK